MFHVNTIGYVLESGLVSLVNWWETTFHLTFGEWLGIYTGFISIAVAIIIPFLYELWKRPKLEMLLDENKIIPNQSRRYIHGKAINKPHKYLSWIERYPADCKVELTFYDIQGNALFNGESLEAKWSRKPRCLTFQYFDDTKVPFSHHQTINSNYEGEPFDIVKNQGSCNCYGFNGWSYGYPNEENPEYAIPTGDFTIRVRAFTGRYSVDKEFYLRNNGSNIQDVSLSSSMGGLS
jgi:hypothetical protein